MLNKHREERIGPCFRVPPNVEVSSAHYLSMDLGYERDGSQTGSFLGSDL